jgi:REP element-mobilizing transposase RayT
MTLYRNRYRVEPARLCDWDYSSPGCYFVTVCEKTKSPVFGAIEKNRMVLNKLGMVARDCWIGIPNHFPFVTLDEYCIMPDHVHGIIRIRHHVSPVVETQNIASKNFVRTTHVVETQNIASLQDVKSKTPKPHSTGNTFGPQSMNLGAIIRGFKIGVTKYARQNKVPFQWQPRFHDHIIRDEKTLFQIRTYIRNNPADWDSDEENPCGKSPRYVAMLNPQKAFIPV